MAGRKKSTLLKLIYKQEEDDLLVSQHSEHYGKKAAAD